MKRISDYNGLLESDAERITSLLKEWKPSSYSLDERTQEQSLYLWLKQKLADVPIKCQYGIAWGIADIVLQDEFVIELKLGFDVNKVGDFDRCLGQLWRYKEKWTTVKAGRRVWLVVVGESEAEFRHLLRKWIGELNGGLLDTSCFEWIEKRPLD